jgi:predicted nuclease of predicted toxin-antitoxin system
MKIKVDEDLPNKVIQVHREQGYQAVSIIEQEMGGFKDADLWSIVQAEQRFLITADKGFADIRLYPPGTHCGVLLLRPDKDGIKPILSLLEHVLGSCDLNELNRTVTVATPRGIRIRN